MGAEHKALTANRRRKYDNLAGKDRARDKREKSGATVDATKVRGSAAAEEGKDAAAAPPAAEKAGGHQGVHHHRESRGQTRAASIWIPRRCGRHSVLSARGAWLRIQAAQPPRCLLAHYQARRPP